MNALAQGTPGTPKARTRVYCNGQLEAENFPVCDVSNHLDRPDTVVWVDFCAPTEEGLDELANELGLHELAVEDALSEHQRPKLDHYASHKFLVCHAVSLDDNGSLSTYELDVFINDRWLVTVRKDEGFSLDPVLARWDRSTDLAKHGISYLLYGLIDVVVDGYFETVECFDEFYDKISEGIFAEKPIAPAEQKSWFETRQSLIRFHRLVVPMREAVSALMRREHSLIPDALYPYYQDVYDHVLRVTESTDALRDLIATIVETNLSLRDFRTNQIAKQVTSWAAIIAVPTLITGWYGMNVPYPGFDQKWGAWMAAGLAVMVSGTLYAIFKKREWL
jgi:magnesium transporter